MEYVPKIVFILEDGKYIELTYEEFCVRCELNKFYCYKRFFPLHGMLIVMEIFLMICSQHMSLMGKIF